MNLTTGLECLKGINEDSFAKMGMHSPGSSIGKIFHFGAKSVSKHIHANSTRND